MKSMFLLLAIIAVLIAGALFLLQVLRCNYCPHKKECEESMKNGGDPLCEYDDTMSHEI